MGERNVARGWRSDPPCGRRGNRALGRFHRPRHGRYPLSYRILGNGFGVRTRDGRSGPRNARQRCDARARLRRAPRQLACGSHYRPASDPLWSPRRAPQALHARSAARRHRPARASQRPRVDGIYLRRMGEDRRRLDRSQRRSRLGPHAPVGSRGPERRGLRRARGRGADRCARVFSSRHRFAHRGRC